MNYRLADSRTGKPFVIRRQKPQQEKNRTAAFLDKLFARLGWKPVPGETTDQKNMKEIEILQPCIAAKKQRKKGEVLSVENLVAAELIATKCAKLLRDVTEAKVPYWERPKTDDKGTAVKKKTESALLPEPAGASGK